MKNTEQGEWAVIIRHGTCSKDQGRLQISAKWNFKNAKNSKGKVLHMREKKNSLVMQARGWLPETHIHRD